MLPAPATSQGLPVSKSDEEELHDLGVCYLQCTELGKALSIKKAVILWKAKKLYCRRGKGSEFGHWLRRYAEDLDRKSADRLANIVEFFIAPNQDTVSELAEFEKLLDRFRLTALYRLASPSVPARAREAALAEAKSGATITPGRVVELIEEHTLPALSAGTHLTPRPASKQRTTIELDGARVVIRAADGDFVKALKAALEELKRSATLTK
jgi:hypothetical protein